MHMIIVLRMYKACHAENRKARWTARNHTERSRGEKSRVCSGAGEQFAVTRHQVRGRATSRDEVLGTQASPCMGL